MRTTEQPDVRMSKNTRSRAFQIALTKTAVKLEGKPPAGGGHVTGLAALQLGEDAIIRVETDAGDLEVRSRQSFRRGAIAVRLRIRHRASGNGGAVGRPGARAPRRARVRPGRELRRSFRGGAARKSSATRR